MDLTLNGDTFLELVYIFLKILLNKNKNLNLVKKIYLFFIIWFFIKNEYCDKNSIIIIIIIIFILEKKCTKKHCST